MFSDIGDSLKKSLLSILIFSVIVGILLFVKLSKMGGSYGMSLFNS